MQKSKVDEIYRKWNDDLYQKYIQLFHEEDHTTIWDGVVDPVSYAKAPFKVMFLNKEAYDEDGNSYDVSEALLSAIKTGQRIFPTQTALRTHLKQYLCVLQSFDRENFSKISDEEMRERIARQTTDENWFNTRMAQVAYCNVKKSDGQSKSTTNDLYNYAKKGLDILKEQIRFFNPSIILAGNVCDGILENLVEWGENLYIAEDRSICIWQIKVDGKCYPFVDMYHPSNIQGMSEYYLNLLHALQAVEEKNPCFWTDRYCSSCFDIEKQLHTNSVGEQWFNKGKEAAERQDWRKAVECYLEATEYDYIPAYRALGKFFDNEYLDHDELFFDSYFNQFEHSSEAYFLKAIELGDQQTQLEFIEDNIYNIAKLNKIVNSVVHIVSSPFKARKKMRKINENAELAVDYMNKLIQEQYEPALALLENWKQRANNEDDDLHYTIKGILEHLNY